MTAFDRFEQRLPALLDELAVSRMPDYADDLLARTAATGQRPGWTFPERWLPMSALTRSFAAVPRFQIRFAVLVALLLLTALIGALVAGSFVRHVPTPFGPAGNGQIAFQDAQGRILLGDPTAQRTTTLVGEPGERSDPLFSQDGSRVFYLQHRADGKVEVMIVAVDGSGSLKLNPTPVAEPSFGAWSASGDRFLLVDGASQLLLYDTSRTAEPRNLSSEFNLGRVSIGLGYNFRSTAAFRPPAGNEIVFATLDTRPSLKAIKLDGTGLRTLIDGSNPPVPYRDLKGAEWSPDGSRLLVLLNQGVAGGDDGSHLFVMNADGSDLRALGAVSSDPSSAINSPLWSPDGKSIAYQYWTFVSASGEVFHPIAVVDVATGVAHDVGDTNPNGYISWEWSPDGTSILEVPSDPSGGNDCSSGGCKGLKGGDIVVVNATDGSVTPTSWQSDAPINWQRVAPTR